MGPAYSTGSDFWPCKGHGIRAQGQGVRDGGHPRQPSWVSETKRVASLPRESRSNGPECSPFAGADRVPYDLRWTTGYGDSHEERGFSLANLSLAVDGDRLKLW